MLELGCNDGSNLRALSLLMPEIELIGVEINETACVMARKKVPKAKILNKSLYNLDNIFVHDVDLVFTKGVLIHIPPEKLSEVYALMRKASCKYIMIAEYHNPVPEEIEYRGHGGKLFKRNFVSELLNVGMKLVDYGFASREDTHFPQDDLHWFLMRKF